MCVAPTPGEGSKGQISLISITKSISKIFIPNFVCVLTNERYKTYQMGFSFCCLGPTPGVGLWGGGGGGGGGWGCPGGQKKIFFKHGHVTSQIDGDDEQKGMRSRKECK